MGLGNDLQGRITCGRPRPKPDDEGAQRCSDESHCVNWDRDTNATVPYGIKSGDRTLRESLSRTKSQWNLKQTESTVSKANAN